MTEKSSDPSTDEIESSSAPLLQHLTELRSRLIWSLVALAVGAAICFTFAAHIYNFLVIPLQRVAVVDKGMTDFNLIATGLLELFFVKLKLALFAGTFISFPVIAWQVYAFIAPGLYKNERYTVLPFLVSAPILFVMGGAFVYFIILPSLATFSFNQMEAASEGMVAIDAMFRVSEYLSLVMALMIAFGLSFQLPVLVSLMGKAGLIGADSLRAGRKYAIVGILFFAAFFTPPDPFSQIMLAIPVTLLYEISIWCVVWIERAREKEDAEQAAGE